MPDVRGAADRRQDRSRLPIVVGTEGERAIDIRSCATRRATSPSTPATPTPARARARSPSSTARRASCATAATRSRSWPRRARFLEVAYLLIYGELPTREAARRLRRARSRCHTMLHEDFKRFFGALPKDAHPMAACSAAVGALATFYPDSLDPRDPRQVEISVHRLIAKMPTIGGLRLQALDRPAVHVSRQRARATSATSCT